MKSKTPAQMTADLAKFITDNHEDVAMPYESIYVELLAQWQVLNRFPLQWADEQSQELYHAYWQEMTKWYEVFDAQRDELLEPAAVPTQELADFYISTVNDLIDKVMDAVPSYPHDGVIKLTDFRVILNNELQKIAQLDLDLQGPFDFAMIIDYWKAVYQAIEE